MAGKKMKVPMGSHVKDVLTGYEGIVTAYTFHITGCDVVAIKSRKLDKDGKVQDPLWVDVNRVEVIGSPPPEIQRVVDGVLPTGEVAKKGGGPQDIPPEFSDV